MSYQPVTSATEAVNIATLARGPETELVALVEDPLTDSGYVMPIDGKSPGPEGIHRLDEILIQAFEGHPGARLIYVTFHHGVNGPTPESEIESWRELCARHATATLQLVDWLVVDACGGRRSLADIAGPPARW